MKKFLPIFLILIFIASLFVGTGCSRRSTIRSRSNWFGDRNVTITKHPQKRKYSTRKKAVTSTKWNRAPIK